MRIQDEEVGNQGDGRLASIDRTYSSRHSSVIGTIATPNQLRRTPVPVLYHVNLERKAPA